MKNTNAKMYFMNEPGELFPQDYGDFDIGLKEAILAEAQRAFAANVLADDMLFNAITATLGVGDTPSDDGPDIRTDFMITPNIKEGKYSLCLEESASGSVNGIEADDGVVDGMHFKFTTMKYVPVCVFDSGKRAMMIDKPFAELTLGRNIATKMPSQEETESIENAVRTFLSGIYEIVDHCSQRGVKLVPDAFGRFQVLEVARSTFYAPE